MDKSARENVMAEIDEMINQAAEDETYVANEIDGRCRKAITNVEKQLPHDHSGRIAHDISSYHLDYLNYNAIIDVPDIRNFLDTCSRHGIDTATAKAWVDVEEMLQKNGYLRKNELRHPGASAIFDINDVASNALYAINPNCTVEEYVNPAVHRQEMALELLKIPGGQVRSISGGATKKMLKYQIRSLAEGIDYATDQKTKPYAMNILTSNGKYIQDAYTDVAAVLCQQGDFTLIPGIEKLALEVNKSPAISDDVKREVAKRMEILKAHEKDVLPKYVMPATPEEALQRADDIRNKAAEVLGVQMAVNVPKPVAVNVNTPAKTVEKTKNDIER